MDKKIEVYIDENNKKIFRNLDKYLNKLKNSVIEQDKKREYYIQREVKIYKEIINEELLKLPIIYRLKAIYADTEWKFYLKHYEEVKDKIIQILKEGLYLFFDEKTKLFDKFEIEIFEVEI